MDREMAMDQNLVTKQNHRLGHMITLKLFEMNSPLFG